MLKKLKNAFFRFFYSLPFGLKGADAEIFGDKNALEDGITITQNIGHTKLSEALLHGEVTQEVEELRYRTYKVAKESENYNYLGEGVAVKNKLPQNSEVFYVYNSIICEGVTHELSRINEYSVNRYLLKFKYRDIPRFKLEKYCNLMKVNLKEKKIELYVEKHTNIPEIRMFFNELEGMLNGKRSEIEDYPQSVNFFTHDTYYEYNINGLSMNKITSDKFQYILTYDFEDFTVNDIVEQYHSDSMAKKYENKEKKEQTYLIGGAERKRYCSACGKEINTYDGDITEKTFGYPLCNDCAKTLKEIQGRND